MKLPRDCNGVQLVKALRRFGYQQVRQTGSHIVMTTQEDIAVHHEMTVEELLHQLDL